MFDFADHTVQHISTSDDTLQQDGDEQLLLTAADLRNLRLQAF